MQQKNTQNLPQKLDASTLWHCKCAGWTAFCHFFCHLLWPWLRLTQLWSWCKSASCFVFVTQLVIVFYQCQPVDGCSVGELFFISMSSVFLSTEVCFLYGASLCWLWHKHTMYIHRLTHTHTPHLARMGVALSLHSITPVPNCIYIAAQFAHI